MLRLHPLDRLLLRMIAYDTIFGALFVELILIANLLNHPNYVRTSIAPATEFVSALIMGALIGCFIGMLQGFFTGIATHFCLVAYQTLFYSKIVVIIAICTSSIFLLPVVVVAVWAYGSIYLLDVVVWIAMAYGIVIFISQRVVNTYLRETDVRKQKVK